MRRALAFGKKLRQTFSTAIVVIVHAADAEYGRVDRRERRLLGLDLRAQHVERDLRVHLRARDQRLHDLGRLRERASLALVDRILEERDARG